MKKYSLLLMMLLATAFSYAAVVQGTVTDVNNQPVANHVVYVNDTANFFPGLSLIDTTDASGNYSVTLPGSVLNGTQLLVSTASCGIMLVNNHIFQGSNITSNFTICATTTNPGMDTISGLVTIPGGGPALGSPAFPAIVYLIEQDFDSANNIFNLNLLDSSFTTQTGYYSFITQINNNRPLLVKAALLPGATNYSGYLPTYYTSSLNWSGATAITTIVPGTTNIQLLAGVNPGGPGFIGGSVLQGANKTTGVGDPLDRRLLILTTQADVPVAYTYSDAAGQFSFANLAYGTYKLFGDAWGKQNPALLITLSAANPSVANVVFEENSEDFTGFIETSIGTNPALALVRLYPNPAADFVTVSGLEGISGTKYLTVTNLSGAVIERKASTSGQIQLTVSEWPSGIYLIHLKTADGSSVYKLVK